MKEDKNNIKIFGLVVLVAMITSLGTIMVFSNNFAPRGESILEIDNEKIFVSDDEKSVIEAVKKANPAVVSIVVTKDVPKIERYFEEYNPFYGFGFGGFGLQVPRYRENGTEEKEIGGGSGFLVSDDGFIVTNRHVAADDEAEYTVFFNDETEYVAEIVAKDPQIDVAVLKIKDFDKDVKFLEFGSSDDLVQGQTVIAIGNALGEFRNSVSTGVVSGLSRNIVAGSRFGGSEVLEEVIQTDAAINPGNSGGPLLNTAGDVIGVNVAVAAQGQNIGFSIPANVVKRIYASVVEFGEIVRPFLGIRYVLITSSMAEKNDLEVDYGALIIRGETFEDLAVIPGSPADKMGLKENDIILEINGVKLDKEVSLSRELRKYEVGDEVELLVLSKGDKKSVVGVLEKAE